MMNAIGATPSTPTGTTPAQQPVAGLQGQSTAGYGPAYAYNPYPSPYPTGLPGSSITGMNPYGGGYGNNMMGMNTYGGAYGNMMGMGNPYGGFQNASGTGGLNPNTGLATGYGFDSAVAPTVFQGSLSGDGTLSPVHPGRVAQEFVGRQNGEDKANAIGLAAGSTVAIMMNAGPRWLRPFRGVPQLLLALGVGTAAGITAKLAMQPSLELLSKQVYLSEDYASNGHIDNDTLLKNNFNPEIKFFNNFI